MRRRSWAHAIREPPGITTPSPRLVRGRLRAAFSLSRPRSGNVPSPLATNGELGEVMGMDWGLGRRLDAVEAEDLVGSELRIDAVSAQLTRHGDVLGTPAYMPPEQARGQRELHGLPSDVYALGAVLYHLLTGRAPYRGSSAIHVLQQVLKGSPVPIVEAAEGNPVPAEVAAICERAMAREIGARYPDAEALAGEYASKGSRHSLRELVRRGPGFAPARRMGASAPSRRRSAPGAR